LAESQNQVSKLGLRLLILSWWTPKYIIRKELENISNRTSTALEDLVSKYADKRVVVVNRKQESSKSIEQKRAAMARTHAKLVEILEAEVGHEGAIKLGREALFAIGQDTGRQTRSKLGVNDTQRDLTRAAKILYRVLGIEFHLDWHGESNATVIIDRCALAEQYSKLTCEVLSATDEGVLNGLQPNVMMKFKEYMTSGCKNCKADLAFAKMGAN